MSPRVQARKSRDVRLSTARIEAIVSGQRQASAPLERELFEAEMEQTRLRLREEELLDENERLKAQSLVLDSVPQSYLVLDDEGCIQAINQAGAELLGSAKPHLTGRSLMDFILKEHLPLFYAHLRRCKRSGVRVSTELHLIIQKRPVPVELLTVAGTDPGSRRMTLRMSIIEAADRYLARQAARQKQRDYETLIESIEGIVWEASARDHRVTFIGPQAGTMLGFPPEWWIKDPCFWEDHIHREDRDRVMSARSDACASRRDYTVEYRMVTARGRTLWLKDCAQFRRQAHGTWKIHGITVDVTALKKAQLALQGVNDMLELRIQERTAALRNTVQSLEGFCYSIAHDLRAPVRSMHGFASLLLDDWKPLPAEAEDYIRRILASSLRMDEMIRGLLDYGRMLHSEIPMSRVNLASALEGALADLSSEIEDCGAKMSVSGRMPPVKAHPAVLHQVLLNLAGNALKFAKPEVAPRVRIRTKRNGDKVRLWVEDNGIGILPEHQARIFNVFERLDPGERFEGTGIGLALVKKGVERMGGTAGVESEIGKGSRFWIELPCARS